MCLASPEGKINNWRDGSGKEKGPIFSGKNTSHPLSWPRHFHLASPEARSLGGYTSLPDTQPSRPPPKPADSAKPPEQPQVGGTRREEEPLKTFVEMQIPGWLSGDMPRWGGGLRRLLAAEGSPLPALPCPHPLPPPAGPSAGLAFGLWIPTVCLAAGGDRTGRVGTVTCDPPLFKTAQCSGPSTYTSRSPVPQILSAPGAPAPREHQQPQGAERDTLLQGERAPQSAGGRGSAPPPPPPRPWSLWKLCSCLHRIHSALPPGVLRCWQMAEPNLLRRRSKKGKLN